MKTRHWILLALLFFSVPALAQGALKVSEKGVTIDVQLSVTPASGYCPYNATATWSATGASVCQKSGFWQNVPGGVAPTGSETISINSTSATFTLTCSTNTDYRDLSWTNPTKNTDGSNVNLTGVKVFHDPSQGNLEMATPIVINSVVNTFRVNGLPAGTRWFGIKVTGQGAVDSVMSTPVSATISQPSGVKTVTVGCTTPPPPNPPTGVTIASTVWEVQVKGTGDNQRFAPGRDVGRIALDRLCVGSQPIVTEGGEGGAEYWAVPKSEVTLYRTPKSTLLLGRCQARTETAAG